MPTNKLWLEHTEKAAWESVQALREKLADAEKRMQRLAPPTGGWQAMLDQLDAAKAELGVPGDGYAQVLGELLSQVQSDRARLRALEQEVADLRSANLVREVRSAPAAARPAFDSVDDEIETRSSRREREVTRLLRRYEASLRDDDARDLDEILDLLSVKVADLSDLDERALPEAASEVAVLALRVAKLARRGRD